MPTLAQTTRRSWSGSMPDVILAWPRATWRSSSRRPRTVPIVFAQVSDPVGSGFVAELARPGGNITGFTQFEYLDRRKWLELLKEIAPGLDARGVMFDPDIAQPEFGHAPQSRRRRRRSAWS